MISQKVQVPINKVGVHTMDHHMHFRRYTSANYRNSGLKDYKDG